MKRLKKFLKFVLISLVVFFVLLYGTIFIGHKLLFPIEKSEHATLPDIEADGFCFGVGCQAGATTVESYMPVFAEQVKRYNEKAEIFWPDNHVTGLYALVQSIEKNRAWLVSPQGEIEEINKSRIKELSPIRPRYDTGFDLFETEDIRGVYLALSEVALKNILSYEKYFYLGTYDMLLTYTHEMFHMVEQGEHWDSPEDVSNRARSDFLDQAEMLTERNLIYRQVLNAVAEPDEQLRDSLVRQLLANYNAFQSNYPDAVKNAHYFDRIEGTAFYFELITSLYSAYPEQVYSEETLKNALRVLARHSYPVGDVGLVSSSYPLGGWSCVLLDFLAEDKDLWKQEIMENSELTPLDILAKAYANAELPEAEKVSDEVAKEVAEAIEEVENKKVAPAIFRMLYQMLF